MPKYKHGFRVSNEYQRETRRKTVSDMYLARKPMHEIAEALGVSVPTISNDLAFLRKQWQTETERNMSEAKAQELARIDRIEEVAWEAWYKSVGKNTAKTVEAEETPHMIMGVNDKGKRVPTGETKLSLVSKTTKVTTREQTGDTRYLDKIQWCIEMRVKMLGLAPKEEKGPTNIININWDMVASNERTPIVDPLGPRLRELGLGETAGESPSTNGEKVGEDSQSSQEEPTDES